MRAVRTVQDHYYECPSQWVAVDSIPAKVVCAPQTMDIWIGQHRFDSGERTRSSASEVQRIVDLRP